MLVYALIPLLPLAAFVTLALSGRRFPGTGHRIVIPAITLSFLLSIGAFIEVANRGPISVSLYRLLESGSLIVELGLFIDQLTVLLLVLVTGVSSVVQVYSSRYMIGDSRYNRFFAVSALFTSAMIMVVMSSNLLMTYIFWEVMGLCSYLLISHYAQRKSAYRAATKVFLVNSVADVGLGFGVILTFRTFGTLDIQQILATADRIGVQTIDVAAWAGFNWPVQTATLITLFLFMGAVGKSAQVPFHVWLPLAMEAPTPVSALIHAATMVNAGPFLLVRLSPLVVLSPTAMTVIAIVGGATALFAALVALPQSDIKRILAYSTISQLGFMTLACGVGAFALAIFHLLAHGFLKAFLFLSTGNVLASTHTHHPETARGPKDNAMKPLFVGALLMSSIPPFVIFSGPYEHLWRAQNFTTASVAFWVVGLGTVFFTSMYIFRGVTSLFQQGPPGARDGESSPTVRPRLFSPSHLLGISLAGVTSVAILMAAWTWLAGFLSPAVGHVTAPFAEPVVATGFSVWILVPLAVAIFGWVFAYSRYRRSEASLLKRSAWMRPWYVFFLNKGYFDEIYDVCLVRPTILLAGWLWRTLDTKGIDRLVVGAGTVTVSFSRWLWQFLDIGGLTRTGERLAHRVDTTGNAMQKFEPRTLQQNLVVMIYWLVAALGFFYWMT